MNAQAIRSWLAVFALAALAACAGTSGVQPANVTAAYERGIMGYMASRGGLPTEVWGNPFKAPDEQVHAAVRQTMERSHFGPDFPFLAEKPQGFASPYRMVVVLDSKTTYAYHQICAGVSPPSGPKGDGGNVRVAAALCAGDSMVTGTAGWASGVGGPDDPAFVALIAQVTHELFPLRDEHDRDQNEIIIP
ncbi:MAG TPA: hypothetical protein VIK47_03140 [Kiloniellales bacterium]